MPNQLKSTPASEEPNFVLAAPGSVTPAGPATARWVLQALAAGSVALVAFRPLPSAAANTYTVVNLNPSGVGSLRQAILDANAHPGADIVNFHAGLAGTIPITTQLSITDSVQIIGPGPGALAVSGSNTTRVFYLYSVTPFTTTISGLTIRDGHVNSRGAGIIDLGQPLILDNVHVLSNSASSTGGGIDIRPTSPNHAKLTLTNSVISGNHAQNGGGLYLGSVPGAVTIQNTQILSNTATQNGAGLQFYYQAGNLLIEDTTIAGNIAGGTGGGLNAYITKGGQHVVRRTTISDNTASHGGGVALYGVGDPFVIENSTISGNHATQVAGGVYLYDVNHVSIRNSTIVSNTAAVYGGGVWDMADSQPITDTIIAGNIAPLGADITGTFELKYDLVQVTGTAIITDAGGNLFGLDPLLGPLANHGGPTQTHLPLPGSPVIDMGDPAFAPPPSTDQRGQPRVSNGRIDIGAVEIGPLKVFLPLLRR